VHVWTGAASDRFSEAANWRGGSPAGDAAAELSFPAGVTRVAVMNDLQGLTVRAISFSGIGYVIRGNAITLAADADVTDREGGPNALACDLVLSGAVTVHLHRSAANVPDGLTISGAIRGSGPLTKVGESRLVFAGSTPNSYSGATRVLDGTLVLAKSPGVTAVPASLTIDGTGTNNESGGVNTLAAEQIADSAPIRIGSSSQLIAGATETVGPLSLEQGARIYTSAGADSSVPTNGTLVLAGNLEFTNPLLYSGSTTLFGDFALSGMRTITKCAFCAAAIDNPSTPVRLRDGRVGGTVALLVAERGIVAGLRAGGDVRLSPATTVRLSVNSSLPLLSAGGVLELSRARLDLSLDENFARTLGNSYVAGANHGTEPTRGTFLDVQEGEILFQRYRISYRGGNGNDLAFTDVGRFRTVTELGIDPSNAQFGQSATLRASVMTSERGQNLHVSGGQVTFRQGDTLLGTSGVQGGVAAVAIQPSWGLQTYSATYEGTATLLPSSDTDSFEVYAPTPVLASMEPSTVDAGTTATVTLRGSGFLPGGQVRVSGDNLPATFVSATEVRFTWNVPRYTSSTHAHVSYLLGAVASIPLILNVHVEQPPPIQSPLVFDALGIQGPVAPGGGAAWLSIGSAVHEGRGVTQAAAAVTPDSDRDGIARWEPRFPLRGFGLAVMVDMTDGKVSPGRLGGNPPPPLSFPKAMFLRDAEGRYTHIQFPRFDEWELLWVRPGVGAWAYGHGDSGDDDLDGASNGISSEPFRGDRFSFQPGGPASQTFTLSYDANRRPEPDRVFNIGVENLLNATFGSGSVTVQDDDFAGITILDASVSEARDRIEVLVVSDAGSWKPVTLRYTTVSGTATAGSDFTARGGTLEFGRTEGIEVVTIPILPDALDEGDETLTVVLSDIVNGRLRNDSATVTIIDDEAGTLPLLVAAPLSVSESSTSGAVFTVRLSFPAAGEVRVRAVTVAGSATAPQDFDAKEGTISIRAGETMGSFIVPLANDFASETPETFSIALSDPVGATLAATTVTATIFDNDFVSFDPLATVASVSGGSVTEGSGAARFTVRLSRTLASPMTVAWTTIDGSAVAAADYVAASGTLTFAPGETEKTVDVALIGDAVHEDDETFALAAGTSAFGEARIVDDDAPPLRRRAARP